MKLSLNNETIKMGLVKQSLWNSLRNLASGILTLYASASRQSSVQEETTSINDGCRRSIMESAALYLRSSLVASIEHPY